MMRKTSSSFPILLARMPQQARESDVYRKDVQNIKERMEKRTKALLPSPQNLDTISYP